MRTLLKVTIPVAKGSQAVADGSLQRILGEVLGALKPEAAYFCTLEGKRSALIVFDLADVSQIPAIAEPLFQTLDASVEFEPVMNQDDLMRGLGEAGLA
jgi:hypothetical protein